MGIIIFEMSAILLCLLVLFSLKKTNKHIFRRFIILFIGVLIFEFFTQPLWHNLNLSNWAYLYNDVSWIITIGWATILLFSLSIVDHFSKAKESKKFFLYLLVSGFLGLIAEAWVLFLGIRAYSPEVEAVLTGITIFSVPIKALYYMPVFMALIIGFTRYFEKCFEVKKPVAKKKKRVTKK